MRKATHIVADSDDLNLPGYLSCVIAVLMTGMSLAGLIFQDSVYPGTALRRSFVSNDVVNLLIGLPILLVSMWLARRHRLIGLLFWPGALFYVTYNYIAYAAATAFSLLLVPYLALVLVSIGAIIVLFSKTDSAAVQQRLSGAVPERFAGGLLVGLGALVFLQAAGQGVMALGGRVALGRPELAVLAADLLTTPVWVAGGIQLWRRQAFGYLCGAGLLFQTSMLFIGLLVFFILQPFLTATPFPAEDFVVVFVMGLVCFVPFGLYVRGILSRDLP